MIGILDVRLGLLRDRQIGDEPRDEQERERRDGQARMTDGVVDGICHCRGCLSSVSAPRRLRRFAAPTGSTSWPSRTKSCPCTISRARLRHAGDPHEFLLVVLDDRDLREHDLVGGIDVTHAEIARGRKVSAERGTRAAGTGASGMVTSAVMPSGMTPSAFGISTSTR